MYKINTRVVTHLSSLSDMFEVEARVCRCESLNRDLAKELSAVNTNSHERYDFRWLGAAGKCSGRPRGQSVFRSACLPASSAVRHNIKCLM